MESRSARAGFQQSQLQHAMRSAVPVPSQSARAGSAEETQGAGDAASIGSTSTINPA
jgi:hypothetical protein